MCEILLRVRDKVSDDPVKNAQLTKRGDVIVVVLNGHVWGEREKDNPDWRIVKLPNVTEAEASMWLAEEPETDPRQPNRMRQRRLWNIDLDALGLTPFLADDSRQQPAVTSSLSFTAIQANTKRRQRLEDPRVLGESRHVL